MDNTEKLQVYVTYENGSMQSWGYDGWGYDTYEKMIADMNKDFPADFLQTYTGVTSMLLVWGEGLPLGDQLKDVPTKELEPMCGPELVDAVEEWLAEQGVNLNGA